MDISNIFNFLFCSGAGEREERPGRWFGGSVFIENRGEGGVGELSLFWGSEIPTKGNSGKSKRGL